MCLHDNNVLKTEMFSLCISWTDNNIFKNNPHSQILENYKCFIMHARPVVGDVTLLKIHYAPAHIPRGWTHNMHAQDITVFTISCFCSLHRNDKGIIFKNLHFENRFQKFAFSSPKTLLLCKCSQKRIKSFLFFVENCVVRSSAHMPNTSIYARCQWSTL